LNKKVKAGLKELVDVVSGKMTLKELTIEIERLYLFRDPEFCVITIERDDKIKGMRGTLYITKKDFRAGKDGFTRNAGDGVKSFDFRIEQY